VTLSVHLNADDLTRIRFAAAPAPVLETVLMLFELRQRRERSDRGWAARARAAISPSTRPLLHLVPARDRALYLDVLTADAEHAFQLVRDTASAVHTENLSRIEHLKTVPIPSWLYRYAEGDTTVLDAVDTALRTFHADCLAPQWSSVTSQFHADIAHRLTTIGEHGLAAMLNCLSPDLHMAGLTITSRYPWDRHVRPNGHGLILMPSAFWTGHPLITWDPQNHSQHVLIYPAGAQHRSGARLATRTAALSALVGGTRAAVLHALRQPRSTSDLADQVGISVSSASEHAATLRDAGIVTSHRTGQAVHHRLTDLGFALLQRQ
jgi:DNA-binding transcriptional ArsR family regulator